MIERRSSFQLISRFAMLSKLYVSVTFVACYRRKRRRESDLVFKHMLIPRERTDDGKINNFNNFTSLDPLAKILYLYR